MDKKIKIAFEFSKEIKKEIGKQSFRSMVIFSNLNTDEGICVSHDFCDANICMAKAYKTIVGTEPNLSLKSNCIIWNESWELAIKNSFFSNQKLYNNL